MCGTRRTTTGTSSFPHTSACVWLPSTTAKSCSLWGRSERPSFGLTFHLGGCPWEVTVDSEREFGRYVRLIIGELIYLKPYCKFFSHVSERRFSYYRSQLERVAHLGQLPRLQFRNLSWEVVLLVIQHFTSKGR